MTARHDHDPPRAGDPAYDGFRITSLWAWTTVDPADDQEGILTIPAPGGLGLAAMPAVASDRVRLETMRPIMQAYATRLGRPVTLRRFTQPETVEEVRPEVETRPAHEWEESELVDRVVVDPDGWRVPDAPDPEAPITLEEYRRRAAASTTGPKDGRLLGFFGHRRLMNQTDFSLTTMFVSPGSGPVPNRDEADARRAVWLLVRDLRRRGRAVEWPEHREMAHDGEGRWATTIKVDGHHREIEMPGCHPALTRSGTPWVSPRLNVDGSSWLWPYALDVLDDPPYDPEADEEMTP